MKTNKTFVQVTTKTHSHEHLKHRTRGIFIFSPRVVIWFYFRGTIDTINISIP